VADPGTSLITHRYIYFAGTLLQYRTPQQVHNEYLEQQIAA
jgi:hypothetical protein